jgi:hypothetical protein
VALDRAPTRFHISRRYRERLAIEASTIWRARAATTARAVEPDPMAVVDKQRGERLR